MNQEDTEQIQIPKMAFIVDSLKHPDEVDKLKEICPIGFYMFVINESEGCRIKYLSDEKNMGKADAKKLIQRDMEETTPFGQHTRAAVFELADFHLSANVYHDHDIITTGANDAPALVKDNTGLILTTMIFQMAGTTPVVTTLIK